MTQTPFGTVRSFENGQQLHVVAWKFRLSISQFLDYESTSYLDGKIS